jgi:hypothetical protein
MGKLYFPSTKSTLKNHEKSQHIDFQIEISGDRFRGTAWDNKVFVTIPVFTRDSDIDEIIRIFNHEMLHLLAGNSERLIEYLNEEVSW